MINRFSSSFIALAAMVLSFAATAAQVTPEQASTAARNWIRAGYSLDKGIGREVESVRAVTAENGATLHIVALKGGGFLAMGADTKVEPVVAFASAGCLAEDPVAVKAKPERCS